MLGRAGDETIRIAVEHRNRTDDVVVVGLTAADPMRRLASMLDAVAGAVLCVNAEPVSPSSTIEAAGLCDGCVVSWARTDGPQRRAPAPARLAQVAGLRAGTVTDLGPGHHLIGPVSTSAIAGGGHLIDGAGDRGPAAVWCRVSVDPTGLTVSGLGPDVRIEGSSGVAPLHVVAGSSVRMRTPHGVFELAPGRIASTDAPIGPVRWSRPPRPAIATTTGAVDVTGPGDPPRDPAGFSWLGVLAPLPVAAIMAVVYRPVFALFAVMGPLVAIARWFGGRRSHRRHLRTYRAEREGFRHDLREIFESRRVTEQARRRAEQPPLHELLRRVVSLDARLWERRPDHEDFGRIAVASTTTAWTPPIDGDVDPGWSDLTRGLTLVDVPVTAELTHGPLGISGPRPAALACARAALASAVATMGPADLAVAVVADPDRLRAWEWLKWLPHLRGAGVAHGDDDVRAVLASVAGRPLGLIVVDAAVVPAAVRSALAAGITSGVVITAEPGSLPASCASTIELSSTGATVADVNAGPDRVRVTPIGTTSGYAVHLARALARIEDLDDVSDGEGIPGSTRLDDLVDGAHDSGAVAAAWRAAGSDPEPRAVLGAGAEGIVEIDLARDGPHALVAGTTGSGKSELLRALITSLCLANPPDQLQLVLIDYKGGGAFDACSALPHTATVITDLDDHLGARALSGLRAELRRREAVFRELGSADLADHRARGGALARLVVVIDEFATLAAELPDFLDALVDLAQRGRSLGIHLILATQRPAGVLDGKIRSNTNLRICLRVQDDGDSLDVLGTTDAARLGRSAAGRAFVRLGAGDITEFQTAFTGGPAHPVPSRPPLHRRPFRLGPEPDDELSGDERREGRGAGQLTSIVGAIAGAADLAGATTAVPLWSPPLPERADAEALLAAHPPTPGRTPIGLADRIDEPTHQPVELDIADGHALVYGADGSAAADVLVTVAIGLAHGREPDDLHLYGIDHPPGPLAAIDDLPHCGDRVNGDEPERVDRLLRILESRLERPGRSAPAVVVLVDGLDQLLARVAEERGGIHDGVGARLFTVLERGPRAGVIVVATAANERSVTTRVASRVANRFVMHLSDPAGLLSLGINPRTAPELTGHRAIEPATGRHLALASFGDRAGPAIRALAATTGPARVRPPQRVLALDEVMATTELSPGRPVAGGIAVPVGLDAVTFDPVELELAGTVVVIGPPGSGRTTTLRRIVHGLVGPIAADGVVCLGSPALAAGAAALGCRVTAPATPVDEIGDPGALVVDDTDRLDAPTLELVLDIARRRRRGPVVIGADISALTDTASPLRALRGAANGIVLQPRPSDGEIFRVVLPQRAGRDHPPGRGYVIGRTGAVLTQISEP